MGPFEAAGQRHDFHLRWAAITPPLRPSSSAAAAMQPYFAGAGLALQLGVTPEIAWLPERSIAADISEAMVELAWPKHRPGHVAVVADWLALPLADASIGIAFGDGCLSMLDYPRQYAALLRSLRRVLRPGGRLLLRCFAGPEQPASPAVVAAAALSGGFQRFSAFKLGFNIAAYAATAGGAVSSAQLHSMFAAELPDRAALSAATGWSLAEIDSIDAYRAGASLHSYPTRSEITAVMPAECRHQFIETTGYELAEHCPLLLLEMPAT